MSEMERLMEKGIVVESATQPVENPRSATGILQQNISMIFSRYDNDQRREKCVSGMITNLRAGKRVNPAPKGYNAKGNGESELNEDAEFIRKAFYMKADEKLSNIEIVEKLAAMGFNISMQQLQKIFQNPFYCGKIVNSLLDGEVVEGIHDPLISEAVFLKVNNIIEKYIKGSQSNEGQEQYPLKAFVCCDTCGKPLTAYKRIKGKHTYYYYKCNTNGCKVNIKTCRLHELFKERLEYYHLSGKLVEPFKEVLKQVFQKMHKGNADLKKKVLKNLAELNLKKENAIEKFLTMNKNDNVVGVDSYHKVIQKLDDDIQNAT